MTARRAPLALLSITLLLFLVASLNCRKARGGEDDPLLAEARTDFLGYLRVDTSNPPGNETSGARYLQQLLAKEGIESKLIGSNPARQSLYARLKSGSSEKALLLLHHIDVVPVVASEWTKPPFGGVEAEGYIWGRGALDIKSLGIAELMAMIDLKRRNVTLRRDVVFLAVADEEMGGLHGCKELLDTHPELFSDVGFVLNEGGGNETIVDKVAFWGIEVRSKVPLWLRIHAKGMAGHSASPPLDGGAVAKLVRMLGALQQIPQPYRLTPEVERYFHDLGRTKNDARGEVMRAMKEPLDSSKLLPALGPGYCSLLHDTVAITRVNAGYAVNVLPTTATADVDLRLLPDETPTEMIAKANAIVGKDGEVEVLLAGEPAPASSADTELYRVLAKEMTKAEPGSSIAPIVGVGTSDSRFFRLRGITAYGIAPFKVNYYDADSVHGTNERIRPRFFSEGVSLTRKIVASFCAREE